MNKKLTTKEFEFNLNNKPGQCLKLAFLMGYEDNGSAF